MSYSNDREELRKQITTLALEGERLVLLDNLAGAVGNDMPDAAHRLDIYIPWEYVFADAAVTGTTAARRGSPR